MNESAGEQQQQQQQTQETSIGFNSASGIISDRMNNNGEQLNREGATDQNVVQADGIGPGEEPNEMQPSASGFMNLGQAGGFPAEQQAPSYRQEPDEIVQVIYQSNQNGSMVGVESSLLGSYEPNTYRGPELFQESPMLQQSRVPSTLPSVAEEGTLGAGGTAAGEPEYPIDGGQQLVSLEGSRPQLDMNETFTDPNLDQSQGLAYNYSNQEYNPQYEQQQQQQQQVGQYGFEPTQNPVGPLNPDAIYSTINKQQAHVATGGDGRPLYSNLPEAEQGLGYAAYDQTLGEGQQKESLNQEAQSDLPSKQSVLKELNEENLLGQQLSDDGRESNAGDLDQKEKNQEGETDENEVTHLFVRQKQGAAESGSFRRNFRKKKLGVSVSTNENELTAHRKKLLESQEVNGVEMGEEEELGSLPKFKRTHSVSFNVSRGSRHSVDIRNLPSYLTVKRASIVDVAKGAMSSLIQSFGGSSQSSQRRDSSPDDEPIFEEPIAPTLSLGQRVALVKNSGAEFGTVGWIGQLPDIDDDWIVGVIFDNMIGDCDGAYNGVRYFYARENYAMFVPLSSLTKTDNYIGRPETGTMLSRMSVSLKPGQLISIQRSSIRLQHCFLNAPHQRVGHDVRAVSNRLHCQCHNCGPCAHLTKQGRVGAIPPFGVHHAPNKKNSLAHAAVEILAHHHHHYHEEEHKQEDQYQFGDNAAHACNFVRYSCCQQNEVGGHNFSADCQMVRPELLDNLIHAPRAPHRRSRPRRRAPLNQVLKPQQAAIVAPPYDNTGTNYNSTLSTVNGGNGTIKSWNDSEPQHDGSETSYSSRSSSYSSDDEYRDNNQGGIQNSGFNYQYNANSYQANNHPYSTIDSRVSVVDQQRFSYQRDGNPQYTNSLGPDDDYESRNHSSIGSSIRRCIACIMCRKKRKRRPKKRRITARARLIEYRRKQSTFVPSTLAKPQDDFASHGLVVPALSQALPEDNSDYSSYSKSSRSSLSKSPLHEKDEAIQGNVSNNQQTFALEHDAPPFNGELKSSNNYQSEQFKQPNYGDYMFSDESYNKNAQSHNSTLTDLGYYDSWANSSNDTLKQMIDQSINDEVARPEPLSIQQIEVDISPLSSNIGNNPNDQIDISSPTVSLAEQEVDGVCQQVNNLDLEKHDNLQHD